MILTLIAIAFWACTSAPRPRLTPPPLPAMEAPEGADRDFTQGWYDLSLGHVAEAQRAFVASTAPEALRQAGFGFVSRAQGNQRNARAHFEKALVLAPETWIAAWGLSMLHDQGGDSEAAVAVLELSARHLPENRVIGDRLAELRDREARRWQQQAEKYRRDGSLPEALEALEKALRYAPGRIDLLRDAARLQAAAGDQTDAIPHLEAIVHSPAATADDLRALGNAYEETGDLEAAYLAFSRWQASRPEDPEARKVVERVRDRFLTGKFPPRFRAIFHKATLTREDLVALIDHRFGAQLALRGQPPVILSDVPGSYVEEAIVRLATFGVIRPASEHHFDRFAPADRTLLAEAIKVLYESLRSPQERPEKRPPEASLAPADVPPQHRGVAAITLLLDLHLLPLDAEGRFLPESPVSPLEALAALSGLNRLLPHPGH